MDGLDEILINWGYVGLFVSALIAGSILVFSSELVLTALVAAGADPVICIVVATLGNTIGGIICYWVGYIGNIERIERRFGVKSDKIDKFKGLIRRWGACLAFFGFTPIVGDVILISLGFLKVNFWATTLFMFAGKLMR